MPMASQRCGAFYHTHVYSIDLCYYTDCDGSVGRERKKRRKIDEKSR